MVDAAQRRRVTAADVAAAVGLSVATVSLVVNGKADGRVSQQKQALVWEAVDRLGYAVDPIASSLSTGLGSLVALVTPDTTNPFFSRVTMGVAEVLGHRYQLLLGVTEHGHAVGTRSIERMVALRLAGLLVDSPSARLLRDLHPDCPIVLLDAPGVRSTDPTVNMDVRGGARRLADHLLDLGHRELAYMDAVTKSPTFAARRSVLLRQLAAGGANLPRSRIVPTHVEIEPAAAAFAEAWPAWREQNVTAVVCATDMQAYGVLGAARELGVVIPEEIALTGFDDLPYSAITEPALTSVELPAYELGRRAATLLRAIVEGREETLDDAPFGGVLKVRASTAGR